MIKFTQVGETMKYYAASDDTKGQEEPKNPVSSEVDEPENADDDLDDEESEDADEESEDLDE